MACACGSDHTITVSNDGVVHCFGYNSFGQLGLGHNVKSPIPSVIPNLPKIKQVSCGGHFTVCVDYEEFVWAFGQNYSGQLGTGNNTNYNIPQKILNIPPVFSVSCGNESTLIITIDSNLWSCGNNFFGQLCLENRDMQLTFKQTSFSDIVKVSIGAYHSLFQNNKGEIYACGANSSGELGLGFFDSFQITPTLIPNLPLNIIEFVCGNSHSLFLDSDGNVFSVGSNYRGQLGLANNTNQNTLHQIPDLPSIQSISCVGFSSYLIDFGGNLWSFGDNENGQLGHGNGDSFATNLPTKIECLKDIRQISYGSRGNHFLAKDSQNQIFVTGSNCYGQLGTGDTQSISIPKEIDSQYLTMWGDILYSKCKSARK